MPRFYNVIGKNFRSTITHGRLHRELISMASEITGSAVTSASGNRTNVFPRHCLSLAASSSKTHGRLGNDSRNGGPHQRNRQRRFRFVPEITSSQMKRRARRAAATVLAPDGVIIK